MSVQSYVACILCFGWKKNVGFATEMPLFWPVGLRFINPKT